MWQPTRWLACAFPGTVLALVLMQPWVDPKWLFLDPIAAAQAADECCKAYYGAISNLGIMLWAATAAICLFSAAALASTETPPADIRLAVHGGLLSGWLALDDALLLHERVAPHLGVSQTLLLAVYCAVALAYAVAVLQRNDFGDMGLFLAGGGALAFSVAVDAILHSSQSWIIALEDGAKFAGICCWTAFHFDLMRRLLAPLPQGART